MVAACVVYVLYSCIVFTGGSLPLIDNSQALHESVRQRALAVTHSSGGSARDYFYARKIALIGDMSGQEGCSCDGLKSSALNISTPLEEYFVRATAQSCSCDIYVKSPTAQVAPHEALSRMECSHKIQVNSVDTLAASLLLESVYDVSNLETTKLMEAIASEGKRRVRDIDSLSSIDTYKLVAMALGEAVKGDERKHFTGIIEAGMALLPSADSMTSSGASLLHLISRLSTGKLKMSPSQLEIVTEALLAQLYSADLGVVYDSLESLNIVMMYKSRPLQCLIFPTSVRAGDDTILNVVVKEILGQDVRVRNVKLTGINVVGASSQSKVPINSAHISGTTIDLSSIPLSPGIYTVSLSMNVTGRPKLLEVNRSVAITTSAAVKNVRIGVTSSSAPPSPQDTRHIKAEHSLQDASLLAFASKNDVVHISFDISFHDPSIAFRPHQTFLLLVHSESKLDSTFVATPYGNMNTYRTIISLAQESDKFLRKNGSYDLLVIVGDDRLEPSLRWNAGSIDLFFSEKTPQHVPLYKKSLLHESDNALTALPEISHIMRSPPRRASATVSIFFSALCILALLCLLMFLANQFPDLARLKKSSLSVFFLLCISLVLVLFTAYWLAIPGASFYETLKYMCFLFPVTFIVGRWSVNSIDGENNQSRMKTEKLD